MPDGEIVVSGIGTSGEDGVAVNIGDGVGIYNFSVCDGGCDDGNSCLCDDGDPCVCNSGYEIRVTGARFG